MRRDSKAGLSATSQNLMYEREDWRAGSLGRSIYLSRAIIASPPARRGCGEPCPASQLKCDFTFLLVHIHHHLIEIRRWGIPLLECFQWMSEIMLVQRVED
jgi:hypothetical protein